MIWILQWWNYNLVEQGPTNLSSDGIFFSGSGEFNLQKDSNEYLRFTNSAGLELKENLNINTSTFDVQTDAGGVLTWFKCY